MRVVELRLMFEHDRWATARIFAAAASLPDARFTAAGEGGHATLRETLVHTLSAQQNWRHRAQRRPKATPFAEAAFPTFAALQAAFEAEWVETAAALDAWRDTDLETPVQWWEPITGQTLTALPWHLLYHALNHGTQHRSEVAETLTLLGCSPGDLDVGSFLFERGVVHPVT